MHRHAGFILAFASLAAAQMTAPLTVKGITPADGLEVTLWAAEPNVVNPTNMDIDERGRIWYLEAVNYRRQLKNQPDLRKAGDRIVILEDTNSDGVADSKKIFHQDPTLRSPLGIAVLGNKVYISQSPGLVVYTKDENDNVLDREVLLTGWGGIDHDHGLHAVKYGFDGRLYFNSGDQGFDVADRSGRHFVSSRKGPYYAGTALRMNPDGTGFTVLAHNFRNPYELALDSFGSIWQSDNDDDGNAWTRFNYVMEGGNYGYWGPGGRSWREDRGTHFHQENPGVVPNIERLGAGSPCGLVVYEGKLLPARYRHMPIHAEAGKREIRTYLIEQNGAGYSLTPESTAAGADTWFRPSDVAVGADGALYVADWYDPGVGGHNMGDWARGRIYRIAPKGHKASKPKLDLETPEGQIEALASPTQSIRYLADTKLRAAGESALPVLETAAKSDDPVVRARALWLIGALGTRGRQHVEAALSDSDARFRVLGLRLVDLYEPANFAGAAARLANDPSPAVRREIAVLLQHYPGDGAVTVWLDLARQHDPKDRWYLEALGIGAKDKEAGIAAALKSVYPNLADPRRLDLEWRLRFPSSLPALISLMNDSNASAPSRLRAMEAVAEQNGEHAVKEVTALIADASAPSNLRAAALARTSKRIFSEWTPVRSGTEVATALDAALADPVLAKAAVELADDLEDPRFAARLAAIAKDEKAPEETRLMAIQAAGKTKSPEVVPVLDGLLRRGSPAVRLAALRGLGFAGPPGFAASLERIMLSKEPNEIRSEALRILARTDKGAGRILDLEEKQQLPAELRNLGANLVAQSRNPGIVARAAKVLPPPVSRAKTKLPPPRSLAARQGDVASGKRVFNSKQGPDCASCHSLDPAKQLAGPNLSAIGTKLGKEAMADAILNPSAGIAHEYVTWILDTKVQGQVIGIVSEDTPQRVVVKTDTGETIRLKPADITGRRKSNLSMMPEDLVSKMTEPQFVDLLEYLSTLREEKRASR